MKKLVIIVMLLFVTSLSFQMTVKAEEEATPDTAIPLDLNAINDLEDKKKGASSLYDYKIFQEEDNPFVINKKNKEEYYENLKNNLFVGGYQQNKKTDLQAEVENLELFSKMKADIKEKENDSQEETRFPILQIVIFVGFVAVGIIASFIYIHIRKNKEVKNVYHYYDDN